MSKVTYLVEDTLLELFDEKVDQAHVTRTDALREYMKAVVTGSISISKEVIIH